MSDLDARARHSRGRPAAGVAVSCSATGRRVDRRLDGRSPNADGRVAGAAAGRTDVRRRRLPPDVRRRRLLQRPRRRVVLREVTIDFVVRDAARTTTCRSSSAPTATRRTAGQLRRNSEPCEPQSNSMNINEWLNLSAALGARVRRDPVGRARPTTSRGSTGRCAGSTRAGQGRRVDGPQRRLLHRRQAEDARRGAGELHWFRYEALATLLSGFLLLTVVYYHGGLMVDPIDPKVSPIVARVDRRRRAVVGWMLSTTCWCARRSQRTTRRSRRSASS